MVPQQLCITAESFQFLDSDANLCKWASLADVRTKPDRKMHKREFPPSQNVNLGPCWHLHDTAKAWEKHMNSAAIARYQHGYICIVSEPYLALPKGSMKSWRVAGM